MDGSAQLAPALHGPVASARVRAGRAVVAGVLAAGAATVGWLAWLSRDWPLVHDAPLMHYIAWRMSQGAVPYRDLFDMNFPGVYVLHWLVVRGLGTGDAAWRAFDLGWLVLTGLVIGAFVRPWGRRAAVAAALTFALYHLAGGAWQAGQRDFLLCAFLVAGARGVAGWAESAAGARARGALACGGLALGAAVTVKPHALALAAALGGLILVVAWRAVPRGAAASRADVVGRHGVMGPLGVFAAALAVAPLATLTWLGALGALPAWRAIVFDYLVPLYSRLGRTTSVMVYRPEVWIPLAGGAVLALVGALGGGRFGARHAVAVLGALYGMVHVVAQGKGWEYHLYPLAAFAIILLFAEGTPALARPRHPLALAVLASIVLTGWLLASKAAQTSAAGWERAKAERVRVLAAELGGYLQPGDTVQMLDTTGGGIHALLRLRVAEPTRFIYDFHFFHDTTHPTIRALRAELARELAARPPRLIVLFEQGWPAGGYERVEAFVALHERLAGYDLVRPGPGYRIYAQRDRS